MRNTELFLDLQDSVSDGSFSNTIGVEGKARVYLFDDHPRYGAVIYVSGECHDRLAPPYFDAVLYNDTADANDAFSLVELRIESKTTRMQCVHCFGDVIKVQDLFRLCPDKEPSAE